jgi:tetratricopeptide (TPR) repeat protein
MNEEELKQLYKNALLSFKNENFLDSIGIYQKIIKAYSKNEHKRASEVRLLFNVLTNLGMAYGKLEQYNKSLACFRKSISFAKKNLINPILIAENYLYLGLSYHKLGKKDEEIESLKVSATLGNERAKKLLNDVGIKYFTLSKKKL